MLRIINCNIRQIPRQLAAGMFINLSMPEGITTTFKKKTIWEWLQLGSTVEDAPDCRAENHFLNPLKAWDEAALADMNNTFKGALINAFCFTVAPFDREIS